MQQMGLTPGQTLVPGQVPTVVRRLTMSLHHSSFYYTSTALSHSRDLTPLLTIAIRILHPDSQVLRSSRSCLLRLK